MYGLVVQKKDRKSSSSSRSAGVGSSGRSTAKKSGKSSLFKSRGKTGKSDSRKSLGLAHRRPSSRASIASRYRLDGTRFTEASTASEEGKGSGLPAQIKEIDFVCQYGATLYDTVLLLVVCPKHGRVALSKIPSRGLFLPFMGVRKGESWFDALSRFLVRLFASKEPLKAGASPFTEPLMIDHLRLQLPAYFEMITRLVYLVQLTPEACAAAFCAETDSLDWFTREQLAKSGHSLLGPEPARMLEQLTTSRPSLSMREITLLDALPVDSEAELLRQTDGSTADFQRIYADYLQHTFPSECMSEAGFRSYLELAKLKMPPRREALFRAFAFNQNEYLNFTEFILGLAVVGTLAGVTSEARSGSGTSTGSAGGSGAPQVQVKSLKATAKFKAAFLFAYYAREPAEMTLQELAKIEADFVLSKSELTTLKNAHEDGRLGKAAFTGLFEKLFAVSFLTIRPSGSFSEVSPIAQLRLRQAYPPLHRQKQSTRREEAIDAKMMTRLLCSNCQQKQYTVAQYQVRLSMEGKIHGPLRSHLENAKRMIPVRRTRSSNHFTDKFVCNKLLEALRHFADKSKIHAYNFKGVKRDSATDWTTLEGRQACVRHIHRVCDQAARLFAEGPRVVKMTAPAFIIGDIHGNLHDLLAYERCFWSKGIYFSTGNLVFLGDYVDRGEYSIECTLYLLCLKLIAPDHVVLLRGNHETRASHKEYTFYSELQTKFTSQAEKVWTLINKVFDVLPLVAVVDESIYCAHGGIPSCASRLDQIASLPACLADPAELQLANEILWNDPITAHEYEELKNHPDVLSRVSPDGKAPSGAGFIFNTKRSTGCYFSPVAADRFLGANGLTHLIRAHECIPPGYQFHAGGRCITVFSCSHYCNGINESAVALVHDEKIRIIRVDTPFRE